MKDILDKICRDECIKIIKPCIDDEECYLVGGYIRDLLNGDVSADRDLIVKSYFARDLAIKIAGLNNGYFIPLDEENKIYRVMLADKKNYLDISAMLEDDFEKDINRRDLTINSIVYDIHNNKIIDKNNGIIDFKNKMLRTAKLQNFLDDPLRMLRVYRFAAKYNFNIDDCITDFIKVHVKLMDIPARERVNEEIMKLFEGRYSETGLKKMDESGILTRIFPVMNEVKKIPPNTHHHLPLISHLTETVRLIQLNYDNLPQDRKTELQDKTFGSHNRLSYLKLAGFLHDIGKPDTWTIEEETGRHRFIMHDEVGANKCADILKDLKFSKKQIIYIQLMIKNHIYPSSLVWQESVGSKARVKFYRKMSPYYLDVIVLAMSDRLAALGKDITPDTVIKNLSDLSILLEECYELRDLPVNPKPFLSGNDVKRITGLPESKELGNFVKMLYNEQLEGNIADKSEAEEFLKLKMQEFVKMENSNKLNKTDI